jgi:membrane protease YdiL (CAAX protease family)
VGSGLVMALPALAAFAFPPLLPAPIEYRPVAALALPQFLWKVLVEVPLATALCEEVAFRGVLQALFQGRVSPVPSIIATNITFALWHVVVNHRTVFETNVTAAPHLVPLALAAGLAGVFAGGVLFSLLRRCTGNLAGSIVAHWMVDALMLAMLYPGVRPR